MGKIYEATATERQTAIVARDWQLFAQHPTLVVICRGYCSREVPMVPEDDPHAADMRDANAHPEDWAVVVVNCTVGSYRLLVRRSQARFLYESLLRQYRAREPRATGRYELGELAA